MSKIGDQFGYVGLSRDDHPFKPVKKKTSLIDTDSRHVRSLAGGENVFSSERGSITQVSVDSMPILEGLSVKRLLLEPGSIREPHWHANASELTYCVGGELLVGILGDGSTFDSFSLGAGQMFYAPSGSLHYLENLSTTKAELIVAFSHERPLDFSLGASFSAMSDAVLGNTFGLPASAFAGLGHSTEPEWIVKSEVEPELPSAARFGSSLRFEIESQSAPISTPAGSARVARSQVWPALDDMSMYSLRVADHGMREPHWHPGTAELGYVAAGRARMTVMDPDGSTDTYELESGDMYFIPPAFPHHIENVGDGDFHFLVFFDRPMPADIGYRTSGSVASHETMAAALGMTPGDLPELAFTPEDPLIVERKNPVD